MMERLVIVCGMLLCVSAYNSSLYNSSLDWRDFGKVTPIKDQGLCGSCWAYAVISAIESSVAINNNTLITLNEQQLIECDTSNDGCYGGFPEKALRYAQANGICSNILNKTCNNCNKIISVLSYKRFNSANRMLEEIQHGPLVAFINGICLLDYHGGLINRPNIDHHRSHVVTLIGYGEENNTSYWIGKNSWGVTSGDSGFFRIVRGSNMCGIEGDTWSVNAILLTPIYMSSSSFTMPSASNTTPITKAMIFAIVLCATSCLVVVGCSVWVVVEHIKFYRHNKKLQAELDTAREVDNAI